MMVPPYAPEIGSMRIGIAGPPFSGKTTLFRAVTGLDPDPARSGDPAGVVGLVPVPDPRLDHLSAVFRPRKHTPARLEFVDFPGLEPGVEGERKRQILARLREMDALLLVFDAFSGEGSPAAALAAWELLKMDFLFSDLEILGKRIEKLRSGAAKPTRTQEAERRELELLDRVRGEAERRGTLSGIRLEPAEDKILRGFSLLSPKPSLVVLNEKDPPCGELPPVVRDRCPGAIRLSAQLEREIAELPSSERGPFLEGLGIEEPASHRMVREVYRLLGLISFFTTGEDECRAWTVRAGDDVVTAAGRIHSDLARGFIRAEVYSYESFRELGSEGAVKARGRIRTEGRDYIVKDGDVLTILFNTGGR